MTTVLITLPDQLAQEAQQAGLLSQPALEQWLREQLRAKREEELFAAMSPEEVAGELRAQEAVASPARAAYRTLHQCAVALGVDRYPHALNRYQGIKFLTVAEALRALPVSQ